MRIAAIIVAAGRGQRAGGGVPKQWRPVAGQSSVAHALNCFETHDRIVRTLVVAHRDDIAAGLMETHGLTDVVPGGETRSASVQAGLAALSPDITHVLIHDAARPCVSADVINGVLDALKDYDAAAPAVAVVDALWSGKDGFVAGNVERAGLYRAQTPQGFSRPVIIAAHRQFPNGAYDDVAVVQQAGHRVKITPGCEDNIKITTPADFDRAERILRTQHGHQIG
ncbi:MAG: 2-C-methyl-D-erythritol 4-phosphate cytidylyltransferase [Roseobacter sp.]